MESNQWQRPIKRPLDIGTSHNPTWNTGIAPDGFYGQGIDQQMYSGDPVNTFSGMVNELHPRLVPRGTNPSTALYGALQGNFSKDGVTFANGGITINPEGSPFAVSASPVNKSASLEYNQPGVISTGIFGSWGNDPSIQGNIKIGQQPPQIDTSSPSFTRAEEDIKNALITAGVIPKPISAQVPINEEGFKVHNPLSDKYVHQEDELSAGERLLRNLENMR